MKNFEQLLADFRADEELRRKFHEGLNKFRSDETLSVMEAGIRAARELGYEVTEEDAKRFIDRAQNGVRELSPDELENVAGGGHPIDDLYDDPVMASHGHW